MRKFTFLESLVGDKQVYEDILIVLMEEPMTVDEIYETLKEETDMTYVKRTMYEFLKTLQQYNLVVKDHGDDNVVYYKIPSWNHFRQSTLDPLRSKAKRHIFDNVKY